MRKLLLPFFLCYLLFKVGLSWLWMGKEAFAFLTPLVVSFSLASLLLLDIFLLHTPPSKPVEEAPVASVALEKLHQELSFWESTLQLQPTHRDILKNLSQLYQVLGDEEKSQEMMQKALEVDPNYQVTPSQQAAQQ